MVWCVEVSTRGKATQRLAPVGGMDVKTVKIASARTPAPVAENALAHRDALELLRLVADVRKASAGGAGPGYVPRLAARLHDIATRMHPSPRFHGDCAGLVDRAKRLVVSQFEF